MRLIVLFVGLIITVGVFVGALQFFSNKAPEGVPVVQPQPIVQRVPTQNIYLAKHDIPIGTQIQQDMIDIQPWPQNLLLPEMVLADANKPNPILKMVARVPFQKGEPIMMSMLANDKDPSFLAASLPQGMRAITIAVDGITGAAGFIFPGDRVDVLATHDVRMNGTYSQDGIAGVQQHEQPKGDPVAEVLISNVRVLAVNQKATSHSGEPPMPPSSVTIEVSSADAQKIRLIDNGNGRLSLALRSLKDKDETQMVRPTGVGDLSHLTPPAYFPVIYGDDGKPVFGSPEEAGAVNGQTPIIVTRGVQAQEIEVTRP